MYLGKRKAPPSLYDLRIVIRIFNHKSTIKYEYSSPGLKNTILISVHVKIVYTLIVAQA